MSLTNHDAKKKLLDFATHLLNEHNHQYSHSILNIEFIVTLTCAVIQLAVFISGSLLKHYHRFIGVLLEFILLLFVTIWNGWIIKTEQKLLKLEVRTRIQTIIEGLANTPIQDVNVPATIPTITVARVIRDGSMQTMPFTLLVEGDIVLLSVGDSCPAKASHIHKKDISSDSFILERHQTLTKHMAELLTPISAAYHGFFYFKLLETPLKYTLEASLNGKRPETVIMWQLKQLRQLLITKIIWIVLGISMVVNSIRFGYKAVMDDKKQYEVLSSFQVYIMILLLPLWLPTMCIVCRSYGNAQIQCLLEELQKTNQTFQDKEDVDEFDYAPAPTINVTTKWNDVLQKFWDQLIRFDVEFLARSTGLIESLANTTVICSIDREGTICNTFPTVDQLFFFNEKAQPIVLDVVNLPHHVRFEDDDWEKHIDLLKPLGLNILLNSDCKAFYGKRRFESHSRFNRMPLHGRVNPSQQTCICSLSRAIGFSDDVVGNYISKKCVQTFSFKSSQFCSKDNLANVFTQIFQDKNTLEHHCFNDGDVETILEYCDDFWNGSDLSPLVDIVKKKIFELYQNCLLADCSVVAYSYCPMVDEFMQEKLNPVYVELREDDLFNKNQTFLGLVTFHSSPKKNVVDFIEDLRLAGIRFVYFSPDGERESKSFAVRLGLEMDWNACILLSQGTLGYLELHDIKAKLPRGVQNIRNHIEQVDDIPLHVSLFAECDRPSVQEMIQILQEHGEVVCCLGSSMSSHNVECFAMADIAVSIDPIPASRECHRPISTLAAGSMFSTIPCAISLQSHSSLYSLTQIIREARTLTQNSRQAFGFYIGSTGCLAMAQLASYICGLPPLLYGYQQIWLSWIIIPVISTSFLFTLPNQDTMTYLPVKHTKQLKVLKFVKIFITRFILLIVVLLAVFISLLLPFNQGFWGYSSNQFGLLVSMQQGFYYDLLSAQSFLMLVFVCHLVCMSSSLMTPIKHLHQQSPFTNIVWVVCSLFCLLVQFVYSMLFMYYPYPRSVPWTSLLIGFGTIPINLIVQEAIKVGDIKEFDMHQRRLKLEFNTKLGMHSPL